MPSLLPQYILGLDIGIASIGWAVVDINKEESPIGLRDVGVRTFNIAEVPKTRESLNVARRLARGQRRLIRRRAMRMKQGKRLLQEQNILKAQDFLSNKQIKNLPNNPWQLRQLGLSKQLNNKQWAAVLLHLLKHRGYLSQRKNEINTTDKELGKLLAGVANNHQLLQNQKYQSCAELALQEFMLSGHLRNQSGEYLHTFDRNDLLAEIHLLFKQQRLLGNPYTNEVFEEKFCELFMWQKPALSGDAILKMLGKCRYEEEYKAAKNTYTAETFVWLTKLNNLRILEDGEERSLTPEERSLLINFPYEKAKLTYVQARKVLDLPDNSIFKGLRYSKDNIEKTTLMEMKAFHNIRKALENGGLKQEWQKLKSQPILLDRIGTAFSLYKTDDDIRQYLSQELDSNILDVLLTNLSFDKFINLSLKALYKILPLMEQGKGYDEACEIIYGDHYGKKHNNELSQLLPKLDEDDIRNPVVLRALSQCRKVINAIIRKYGSPAKIHIETGREIGKSAKGRQEIETRQKENQKERQNAITKFKEYFPLFGGEPKGRDILKMRLYESQNGKCIYSGKPLNLQRLIENNYVQIDHVLPFSRTWDDSFNNKVLVLTGENQNKANKTPYEWFDGKNNSLRWQQYVALVESSQFSEVKKQKLLTKVIDEKSFKDRNLNDTRYIAKFLCNWLENKLTFTTKNKKHIFASNGQITALLRNRWGISKNREENDRHHAIDAIVVACSTPSMQKKITEHVRRKEMNPFTGEHIDYKTGEIKKIHFPLPWEYFRQEIQIRVFSDNPVLELEMQLPDRPQAIHQFVTPLFVSRMPTRKVTGQGHQETIRSAKRLDENISVIRVALDKIKLADLENMVNRDREKELYLALKERLESNNGDAQKAFAEPFYKKGGQQVKKIRIERVQNTGVLLNNNTGIADNGSMVRVDLFIKNNKYFLVPIYAWQVAEKILPTKAIIQGKHEDEWEVMDETAKFQYSIYPNDLIQIKTKKKDLLGYYVSTNRSTANIEIREHDTDIRKGKKGHYGSLGIKNAQSIIKFNVDVLGKIIAPCKKEKRQGFK